LNEESRVYYKLPLLFEPQPEGGFTVTSPLLPELITEGDTFDDAMENVRDALAAVLEIYQDTGRALPPDLMISDRNAEVRADLVIGVP
jgi:antitoxin HicB